MLKPFSLFTGTPSTASVSGKIEKKFFKSEHWSFYSPSIEPFSPFRMSMTHWFTKCVMFNSFVSVLSRSTSEFDASTNVPINVSKTFIWNVGWINRRCRLHVSAANPKTKLNVSISISSNQKYIETYPNSWSIRCQGNCAIICRKIFSPCVSSTKVQFVDLRAASWRRMGRTAPKHEWPNRITWMLAIPLRVILKIEKKRKIAIKRNCIFVGGHGQIGQTSTDDDVQKQW